MNKKNFYAIEKIYGSQPIEFPDFLRVW